MELHSQVFDHKSKFFFKSPALHLQKHDTVIENILFCKLLLFSTITEFAWITKKFLYEL